MQSVVIDNTNININMYNSCKSCKNVARFHRFGNYTNIGANWMQILLLVLVFTRGYLQTSAYIRAEIRVIQAKQCAKNKLDIVAEERALAEFVGRHACHPDEKGNAHGDANCAETSCLVAPLKGQHICYCSLGGGKRRVSPFTVTLSGSPQFPFTTQLSPPPPRRLLPTLSAQPGRHDDDLGFCLQRQSQPEMLQSVEMCPVTRGSGWKQ